MNFRDFLKQLDEPKHGGNRGVLPKRGHAPSSVPPVSEQNKPKSIKKSETKSNCYFGPDEPVAEHVDDLWYKQEEDSIRICKWTGVQWFDIFNYEPIESDQDTIKPVEASHLKSLADNANDLRALNKDLRWLSDSLAKAAAWGDYNFEVQRNQLSANGDKIIKALVNRGIKVEQTGSFIYMSWGD